ncbi:hypothetical protein FOVG_16506 [Fusarium oxysporum f. sp. pisi HDV247]|uniref:Uncharacterized protein n=2 Tax=Fusarium oxysporum TaxID=5507 RepID=W9NNA5_FUSOX|nr:hypothetical protein FOVG_16506 [Fusarium oxysporum f. sp. pisi HDV247]
MMNNWAAARGIMVAAQSMVLEHSDAAVGWSLRRTKDRFKV